MSKRREILSRGRVGMEETGSRKILVKRLSGLRD